MKLEAVLCLSAAAAVGCGHLGASEDVPAVLVDPTEAVRTELRAALTEALGRAPVAIADDALTQTSTLVIERGPIREPANRPLTGRMLDADVQRFELVVNDGQCALLRASDGWRKALAQARCMPEAP
ncbi:MAG TPA: hypothetical protein VIM81_12365 [Gammaproteobacteria bacterium]